MLSDLFVEYLDSILKCTEWYRRKRNPVINRMPPFSRSFSEGSPGACFSFRAGSWKLCLSFSSFFSVTNAYHFLNKKAYVPVRCVEFFSFTCSPVVLILNKQRQPDWWWKMVSQPQGFFWSALNLWLPRFPNFPFPGHH